MNRGPGSAAMFHADLADVIFNKIKKILVEDALSPPTEMQITTATGVCCTIKTTPRLNRDDSSAEDYTDQLINRVKRFIQEFVEYEADSSVWSLNFNYKAFSYTLSMTQTKPALEVRASHLHG